MRRLLAAVALCAALAALSAVPLASADRVDRGSPVTYAVVGDTPYGQPQVDNFPNDVAEINEDPKVRLVIHLGDIKNGSSVCSTDYFRLIRADFDRFADPLVYTPGDNEWTDCWRANNGGFTPTERLTELRRIFFDASGQTLAKRRAVDDQATPDYPENVSWSEAQTVFGTIHVVGSNNDWAPWFGAATRSSEQVREYTARNAASLAWLDHIFEVAEREDARAVVLGIQADMWDPAFSGPNDDPASYDHFTDFVRELARQSLRFGRPVLLLNGDSHEFVDDRPLADPARPYQKSMYGVTQDVPNLRRITTNGSTTPCHEWIRLRIDPRSAGIFSLERVRFSKQPGFDPVACPSS